MAGVLQSFGYCVGARTIKPPGPAFVSRSDSNLDSRGRQLLHRVIAIVRSENPQKINLLVFVRNVMKRMTDLRCIKARLRVVCFAGYCSNFVEIKSAARPPMFGFVESLTRSRWYRARGLHLTFPRGDFIYRAAECALVGLTKAGSPTHTTFQVSWRI